MNVVGDCRFCLEQDAVSNLIAPCDCKGSSKYVHNTCLVTWVTKNPAINTICKSCGIEYKQLYRKELVEVEQFLHMNYLSIKHGRIVILLFHLLFMIAYQYLYKYESHGTLYMKAQLAFHGLYSVQFIRLIRSVYYVPEYWNAWTTNSRITLPIAHLYFLCMIPSAYWISGIGADICLFSYFDEHLNIVYALQKTIPIQFVSKES